MAVASLGRLEEIAAWQKAKQLTLEVYTVSAQGAFAKDAQMQDQFRTGCVAILTHIVEGFKRSETGEFAPPLAQANLAAGEIRDRLYAAADKGYLGKMIFDHLFVLATETSRAIDELTNYLRKSSAKGGRPAVT
ncbi:MAG: four helix bundle protein [Candidatus Omnitrophica bacterium]|nr:four helix bundle protein [Candidatus Omnitrophota bacterium]